MTETVDAVAAATFVSSFPPATVHGCDVHDDSGLLLDPLLQSHVETTTPNKDVPGEGMVSDLAPAPEESKMEVQTTVPEAENVTPMRRASRSTEVNAERPSWLPEDWGFERKVRTNGATAGAVDRAPATVPSIPPTTVHGGNIRDDGLPSDPLLESGDYIVVESNVDVETTTPNKGEGKVSDLAPAPEMQMAVPEAENVTPVRKVNRSAELNVERPSWLPENWKFETAAHTDGATAGIVDSYYYEPVTGAQFRSKAEVLYFLETGAKRKKANTGTGSDATPSETPDSRKQKKSASKEEKEKSTEFYFDSANPPESVCWTLTNSRANTWAASANGNMVPDSVKQQWDAVYSIVSKLPPRNT